MSALLTIALAVVVALALLAYLCGIVHVLTRAADAPHFDHPYLNLLWDVFFAPERSDVPLHWRL